MHCSSIGKLTGIELEEIRIGSHVLQPKRQLLRDGEHVHLGPRALTILTILAEAQGQIVTKDELMEAVWPDVTVEENALQVHIASVRKALGEDADLLRTVRGIGYSLESGATDGPDQETAREKDKRDAETLPIATVPPRHTHGMQRPSVKVIALLLGILVAAAGMAWLYFASADSSVNGRPEAIVVLPVNIGGDDEWISREQAFTASIAGNLARLPDIEIASETAANAVIEKGLSPREIGDRLDVDHIVENDILVTEDRVVSQLRLISADTGRPVWTGEVTSPREYSFELEPLILNRLSGVLIALRLIADGDVEVPDDLDPRARAAYLDGLAHMTMNTVVSYAHALRQMQLAASIEPEFAAAHAGVAFTLANGTNYFFSLKPDVFVEMQEEALQKAFALDPDNFMARTAQGYGVLNLKGDVASGLELARELVSERPADTRAQSLMAAAYRYAGDSQKALEHIDRAIAGDPFNFVSHIRRRHLLVDMGDYMSVRQSALSCRSECWLAGVSWFEALTMHGNRSVYFEDIDRIAALYDDERAYESGPSRTQAILLHGRYLFEGEDNPLMRDFRDNASTQGISHWMLMVMKYGYVDAGFSIGMRGIEGAPAFAVIPMLSDHRLTPSREIRADPRYHAIFDIPRFKAVADYRKSNGQEAGLPVFPVKPYGSGI